MLSILSRCPRYLPPKESFIASASLAGALLMIESLRTSRRFGSLICSRGRVARSGQRDGSIKTQAAT